MGPSDLGVGAIVAAAAESADYAEERGDLHPAVWQAIREAPLTRALLPTDTGGANIPIPRLIESIEEVSKSDGSAGWACAIHCPAAAFIGFLEPSVAIDIVKDNWPPLIGGASLPAGHGTSEPGGFMLSGTWPLVTGSSALTWAALAAVVDDERPAVRWFLVPADDITVHNDWDAIGLRGTGSNSVTVSNLFVPSSHRVDLTGQPAVSTPLSRFPIFALMAACIAAVGLGVARRAQDVFSDLSHRASPRHATGTLAQQPYAQMVIARSKARLDAARQCLLSVVEAGWSAAQGDNVRPQDRADIRAAAIEAVVAAAETSMSLYEAAGVAGVYRANVLELCVRDTLVVKQHAINGPSAAQKVGRLHLLTEAAADL